MFSFQHLLFPPFQFHPLLGAQIFSWSIPLSRYFSWSVSLSPFCIQSPLFLSINSLVLILFLTGKVITGIFVYPFHLFNACNFCLWFNSSRCTLLGFMTYWQPLLSWWSLTFSLTNCTWTFNLFLSGLSRSTLHNFICTKWPAQPNLSLK